MSIEVAVIFILIGFFIALFLVNLSQVFGISEQTRATQKEVRLIEDEIEEIRKNLFESNARLKTRLHESLKKHKKKDE